MPTSALTGQPDEGIQARRRAETRAALLDATVECLAGDGYAKTTTGRIAERAGLSRGAQLPYFRSRADLLAAAIAHLAERRIADFNARIGTGPVSVEECVDVLWAGHQPPMFEATLELWVAARTDPELQNRMVKVEHEVTKALFRAVEAALGDLTRRPGFADEFFYALASIRGLALLQISNGPNTRLLETRWRHMRSELVRVLG